jgi:hypothetical protein
MSFSSVRPQLPHPQVTGFRAHSQLAPVIYLSDPSLVWRLYKTASFGETTQPIESTATILFHPRHALVSLTNA